MFQGKSAQPLAPSALYDSDISAMQSSAYLSMPLSEWQPALNSSLQTEAIKALEQGKIICLPQLPFILTKDEKRYLRSDCVKSGVKSIKYSPVRKTLWGTSKEEDKSPILAGLLQRYAASAQTLINAIFPGYAPYLSIGNTSFRPVEAKERVQSARHDDQLLHVDAFPSRPNRGQRILRVFTNIHPNDLPRLWRVGEPFAHVAARFMPKIPRPLPGSSTLLRLLKITKGKRSLYDHYMLQIHDRMKLDQAYQQDVSYTTMPFLPGTSWIVFSDQVSHAVVSGQHAMEQTFMLPVAAMAQPDNSPLRVLENLVGKNLH